MSTKEKNHNDPLKLRERFLDFEADPPPNSWALIREELARNQSGSRSFLTRNLFDGWFQSRNWFYPAFTLAGIVLITLLIWVGSKPTHHIDGQALVNQSELVRGTAYLFRVKDHDRPLDSVRFFDKRELDSTGHFAFRKLPSGSYMLRVYVHPDSPLAPDYHHGYYGDELVWHKATLIHTDHPQKSYVVTIPKIISK